MANFQNLKQEIIAGDDAELRNALIMMDAATATLSSMQEIDTLYATHIPAVKKEIETNNSTKNSFKQNIQALLPKKMRKPVIKDRDIVDAYFEKNVPYVSEHSNFKLLDSPADANVKQAVAVQWLAMDYQRNEKVANKDELSNVAFKGPDRISIGENYRDFFRQTATAILQDAAQVFEDKGHDTLRERCHEKIADISINTENLEDKSFMGIVNSLAKGHIDAVSETNSYIPVPPPHEPHIHVDTDYIDMLYITGRLADNTPTQQAAAPALIF